MHGNVWTSISLFILITGLLTAGAHDRPFFLLFLLFAVFIFILNSILELANTVYICPYDSVLCEGYQSVPLALA